MINRIALTAFNSLRVSLILDRLLRQSSRIKRNILSSNFWSFTWYIVGKMAFQSRYNDSLHIWILLSKWSISADAYLISLVKFFFLPLNSEKLNDEVHVSRSAFDWILWQFSNVFPASNVSIDIPYLSRNA